MPAAVGSTLADCAERRVPGGLRLFARQCVGRDPDRFCRDSAAVVWPDGLCWRAALHIGAAAFGPVGPVADLAGPFGR